VQRSVVGLGLLLALPLAPTSPERAQAQAATISPDGVLAMLSGFEEVPTREDWRALGRGVLPVLARIADDDQHPGYVRIRAVQAAAAFATPAARGILRRALRDREPLVVREATLAMQQAFGGSALADVAPLLAHRDTAVREAAIRALGAMKTEAARAHLRRRLASEPDAALREEIERALAARAATDGQGGRGSTDAR
jgi:HEAT repeat protein